MSHFAHAALFLHPAPGAGEEVPVADLPNVVVVEPTAAGLHRALGVVFVIGLAVHARLGGLALVVPADHLVADVVLVAVA